MWLLLFQGWKGSAKTRPLILALRDYLVERVEHSEAADASTFSISPVTPKRGNDNEYDPETSLSNPLPDRWIIEYLQVKRLQFVQREHHLLDLCS
jgi:hypothetical protein